MFNWFKSKVELKNENNIMSSIYNKKGLKIGSEISVPTNFECLIYNNGRYYFSLPCGKHKVNTDTFSALYLSQQKRKGKTKYIKCVCHYINKSNQSTKIRFKKHKYTINFEICDLNKFAELVLLYAFKVDNNYVETLLFEILYELLLWHKGDYKQISKSSLEEYGIIINSFLPEKSKKSSIFNQADDKKQEDSIVSIFDTNLTNNTISNAQHLITENIENINTSVKEDNVAKPSINQSCICPNCNNISKFKTAYCLKCGYKIE